MSRSFSAKHRTPAHVVQHATRLQKLLANIAHDIFNPGDTSARKSMSCGRPASSARGLDSKDLEVKPKLPKKMRILLAEDHLINMKVACAGARQVRAQGYHDREGRRGGDREARAASQRTGLFRYRSHGPSHAAHGRTGVRQAAQEFIPAVEGSHQPESPPGTRWKVRAGISA